MQQGRVLVAGICALVLTAGAATLPLPSPSTAASKQSVRQPKIAANRVELDRSQVLHALATGALDREVKTLLKIREKLHHGEFKWDDDGVPAAAVWVRVDRDAQLLSVFRGGHEIGTAVILFGAEEKQTPSGKFRVRWKRPDHYSSTYDAPMPYTLNLTEDGVAIHGSDVRRGSATHGCIGIPLEFARLLFQEVRRGDEVVIV
jgi:hypothetical protein